VAVLLAIGLAVAAALGVGLTLRGRARPNLLLVTIDTLRADHVGAYGYTLAKTPVLDDLARRGVRFESAHSAVPLTGPSHATILTGEYPPRHGVRENVNFILDERHVTLATRLKRRGYHTAAFVAAYPVAKGFGFGQGFDDYNEGLHPNPGIGQGAERPANEVADSVTTWIGAHTATPFFVWVHFYDPHAPYTPPSPFREEFKDHPYDGEIAFADSQLGRILEALTKVGHRDDTLVIVLADHGEGLGEHGEASHGLLLYESTLRIPWIIEGPGVPKARVARETVGTVDLAPTALALLGIEASPPLPGRNLTPLFEGRPISPDPLYSEALFGRLNCRWSSLRGFTKGSWKLIEGVEPELFDLSSDPGERRNRADEEPERLQSFRSGLRGAVAFMAAGGDKARPSTIAPDQAERLASLGYTAGSGGAGDLDAPGLPDPRRLVGLFERLEVLQSATGPALRPAIRETADLLSRDPDDPFGHFVMAALAYRAGELELAQKAFTRCLELDPDRPVIRQYFGALLRDLGRLEESEKQLRIAVAQAAADDYLTQINLADTLVAQKKTAEAREILSGILLQSPNHTKAHAALGRLYLAAGSPREAIPELEAATNGAEVEPFIELGEAYLAAEDPARAQNAAAEALKRSPEHPWALGVAGHALVLEQRREEGLLLLKRALALKPRRPEVWRSLSRGFAAAGDASDAALCRTRAEARGRGDAS
jgi:arylsulfatase A-like enzyme/Tfp pilus assembly protein PilF